MWLKFSLISSKLAALKFIRFDVRPHQNYELIETSLIVKRYKLYIYPSRFWFLSHFLPPVATWATNLTHRPKSAPGCRYLSCLSAKLIGQKSSLNGQKSSLTRRQHVKTHRKKLADLLEESNSPSSPLMKV